MKILGRSIPSQVLHHTLATTLICGPFISPHSVLAAVDYFELDPEQLLSAQVVSVSKHLESVAESPAAIYVVSAEDIERSGVTTIADALRMVPGVDVARNDANTWAISIRGFNSALANKLLVLIDGRTIYNPVFGGTFWEAHDLPMADIERIEVVRGPGGALWGANAVNGVINIITKSAKDTSGNHLSGILGNEELGTINARHGGQIGNDAYYRVYTKAFRRDDSKKLDGSDAEDAWDGLRSGFKVDWANEFTLQGDIYRNQTQQRRANYSLVPPYAPVVNQNLVYRGVNLLGRWTQSQGDGSQFSLQSYIDWAERDEPINFIDKRTIYDIEAQYNFAEIHAQQLTLGAGVRYLSDDKISHSPNVAFEPQSRDEILYQLFIQEKVALIPNSVDFTLGAKAEHTELSGLDFQPNARLQWHINDDRSLWLSASRAVRTPTPFETDITTTLDGFAGGKIALVPNKNFQAEELTAYELGYRQQFSPSVFADMTTFYNDYDRLQAFRQGDFIFVNNGSDPVHVVAPIQFNNDATGVSRGFEAVVGWSLNPDVKFTATYTHFELDLDTLDALQESLEGANPVDQVGLRAFWTIFSNWTLDTSAYYVDSLPFGDVDNYLRLDINVGGRINQELRFNIIAQNLLDPVHPELKQANDPNSSEIERSIFGKITWEF